MNRKANQSWFFRSLLLTFAMFVLVSITFGFYLYAESQVDQTMHIATMLRALLFLFGFLLLLTLWRAYQVLHATLGCSVDELQAHIARIGRGDLSAPISITPAMEGSVLAWLSETQANLLRLATERKQQEIQMHFRLKLIELSSQVDHQFLMQATLDMVEELTGSSVGFFHFVDDDQENILLQTWSSHTLQHMCKADATAGQHYPISEAGVWADAMRTKTIVIENDYSKLLTKKGMPEGHAPVERFISIPVIRNDKVVAMVGVGNKPSDYSDADAELVSQLANLVWDLIEKNKIQQELRESEEKFRKITESAQDAIIMMGVDERISAWNFAAERLFGYSAAEVIGQEMHPLIAPLEAQQAFKRNFPHFLETGTGPIIGKLTEVTALNKAGKAFPVEVSIAALSIGGQWNAIGIFRDISERKRAEEQLRCYKDHLEEEVQRRTADLVLARDAAEAASKAKSVFLSSMSHELRTPLNAILGFSSLMRRDPLLNEAQQQNLDIINRSGAHLLTLINDVLEMSKIEAGRLQLDEAPFDLGVMVRDVTDMMAIRAREKGLHLLLDQSSHFPRYINGDEARLRQILINLIGNAIKFTQQGGVTVRLGTKDAGLVIEVEDSGPGISSDDQQRLFQPFVQLGKELGDNQGTGLGLAITRQFVQLMGGSIKLESTLGQGSLFRIELPLSEINQADIIPSQHLDKYDVIGLVPGQPEYRILIVEDQVENQLLLTHLMQHIGFSVKVAEDGAQGVKLFQSWQPHLIWMDRRMPVMDGMEATKIIRNLPGGKEVKIVAVTASAFTEQREEMLAAGMDDFIRKPYRFSEIYDALSRQLGVQYIYADTQDGVEKLPPVVLTAEMLAVLPLALRCELRDALQSLESERISAVVKQVSGYDATLYQALSCLVDNFDYPAILKILKTD